jgi:uncharacterized RDD family membrane protein YckC
MSEEQPTGGAPGTAGPGPAPGDAGTTVTGAGLGVRIGARLVDFVLVAIPAAILLGLLGIIDTAWGSVVASLLYFGYFVWLESSQGATLGKKLLSLRVVGMDGALPSLEVAAKRNVWMLFGLIPVIGPLLSLIAVIVIIVTISSSPDNRGYHDTFAGSRVLR